MSSLKSIERIKLEKFFEMGGGYVCDFTDRTFGDFVVETAGIDVYLPGYDEGGTSKANRLRTFWRRETDRLVGKLLGEMVEYWKVQMIARQTKFPDIDNKFDEGLYDECLKIVQRLKSENLIEDIAALEPNSPDKDFALLSESIKESISRDKPNEALDRLHTFVVKYVRELCRRHGIPFDKDVALHGLFGGYVKFLHDSKKLESEMSLKILGSTTKVFDAFNAVRNNQSFAHDNPVLNHHESIFIFNNVTNTIRFIQTIEQKMAEEDKKKIKKEINWTDIPYTDEEIGAAGDRYIQQQVDESRGK